MLTFAVCCKRLSQFATFLCMTWSPFASNATNYKLDTTQGSLFFFVIIHGKQYLEKIYLKSWNRSIVFRLVPCLFSTVPTLCTQQYLQRHSLWRQMQTLGRVLGMHFIHIDGDSWPQGPVRTVFHCTTSCCLCLKLGSVSWTKQAKIKLTSIHDLKN